jgi:hypothetical protein
MDALLRDVDIIKLNEEDIVLGETIGSGGQATVVKATHKVFNLEYR